MGTRLRPITRVVPKPLLPVAGKPLLARLLEYLTSLGIERVGLNTHHLPDQVEQAIGSWSDSFELRIFHEPEILDTGGGLGQARDFLAAGPTLVINGDVAFEINLQKLIAVHARTGPLVTMALLERPEGGPVLVDQDRVIGFRRDKPPPTAVRPLRYEFSCVQVVEPKAFDYLPADRPGDLIDSYRRLIGSGSEIRGHILGPDTFWSDMGTRADYLALNRAVMADGQTIFGNQSGSTRIIHPRSEISPQARLRGFVDLGSRAEIGSGAIIEDSVIMTGAWIGEGAEVRRTVVGPGARIEPGRRLTDQALIGHTPCP